MTDTRIHHPTFRHARDRPTAPAISDPEQTTDYATFARMIVDAGTRLRAAGAGPETRVLIVGENCLCLTVFIMACAHIGAVAAPVNARMTGPELARIDAHAQPIARVFTSGASAEAAAHATGTAQTSDYGTFHLDAAQPETGIAMPADTAALLYTTGTTGEPKGVMLSHGNLLYGGAASVGLRGMTGADVIYGVLPISHVFGLNSMLVAATIAGAHVRLAARFSPETLLDALRDDVTILPAVPQMHAVLMSHAARAGIARLQGSALKYVSSGAAPLDPEWKRKAEAFYGIALQNGYGMTETTAGVTATRNPAGSPDTSVGLPLAGVDIALDAAHGGDGVGEILTRGPNIMLGYFRNGPATDAVLSPDGWLRTGDLGRIDADGRLHVVGRAKELIIRGGFNVYPPEVEAALNDHPGVIQSAVIGRTLPGGNEEVLAFVQTAVPEQLRADHLAAHVAERLSAYKRPSRIVIAANLPAAATGKILKHRLLAHFAAELESDA